MIIRPEADATSNQVSGVSRVRRLSESNARRNFMASSSIAYVGRWCPVSPTWFTIAFEGDEVNVLADVAQSPRLAAVEIADLIDGASSSNLTIDRFSLSCRGVGPSEEGLAPWPAASVSGLSGPGRGFFDNPVVVTHDHRACHGLAVAGSQRGRGFESKYLHERGPLTVRSDDLQRRETPGVAAGNRYG